jgi:hypothetical protein
MREKQTRNIMKRITKKQQYINELRFDLDYFQGEVSSNAIAKLTGQPYTIWHHGETVSEFVAKRNIAELTEELNKIFNDKNYKPWKETT